MQRRIRGLRKEEIARASTALFEITLEVESKDNVQIAGFAATFCRSLRERKLMTADRS